MGFEADRGYRDLIETDAREQALEDAKRKQALRIEKQYLTGDLQWVTANGERLYLYEMTDEHIDNVYNLLQICGRKGIVFDKIKQIFGFEKKKRDLRKMRNSVSLWNHRNQ